MGLIVQQQSLSQICAAQGLLKQQKVEAKIWLSEKYWLILSKQRW